MTLSLLEGGGPLSAERSALVVVSFVADRHRYSGEQLVNVLIAVGFLCYCDEDNKVTQDSKIQSWEYGRGVREMHGRRAR